MQGWRSISSFSTEHGSLPTYLAGIVSPSGSKGSVIAFDRSKTSSPSRFRGEPLRGTKKQIDRIYAVADRAGKNENDRRKIRVTFQPILAETDELAWAKVQHTLEALQANAGGRNSAPLQNVGSQRLLGVTARGEVQDRVL
ncbi:hypothetical protein Aspvir_009597 [Aspergillus viridinutans]|uniref:Uncharacterized protein n=1 Tax=Aspergillus viridinutans TaxID=75553 RepID=A0A9P3F8L5_ASPVI|nr:uncharacterized protein Aspvir_009597 [Aspergillus viridinutans]GIK05485.1 hypothetical protein Aspvir_009597 [Aspergillus viridinutans]